MEFVEREAVRAILLTPTREILLMHIRNPVTKLGFWICPGGGLNPGEDLARGLKRELREELALESFLAEHLVHKRHHTYNWKEKRISQRETFFIVETAKFTPVISDPEEAAVLEEFRWWPLEELPGHGDPVTPKRLREIIESYLENGPPKDPLSIETLTD